MSIERDKFNRALGRVLEKDRQRNVRPPVMQGRRTEVSVDVNQLSIRESTELRDPSGAFLFVPGYSSPEGEDVVS